VYAATLGVNGVMRTATFPPTTLPQGAHLQVRWDGDTAQLVSASGRVIATAPATIKRGAPFRMLRAPKGVHARRLGRRVAVAWLARARTGYTITSGQSRGAAGTHLLKSVRAGASGRRRMTIRLPRGDRWVGVRALRGSTTSRMVPSRVR
jgi:hypothetical protein